MQAGRRRRRSVGRASSSRTTAPASAPTGCSSSSAASRRSSRRAPDYWGGKPAIDTVIFREVPTSASRVSLLQGGAVDIAQFLQPLRDHAACESAAERRGRQRCNCLVHDLARAQRQDRAVRQCQGAPAPMNFAFPQEEMLRTVYQGLAEPARTAACPTSIRIRRQVLRIQLQSRPRPRSCWRRRACGSGFKTTPDLQCRRSDAGADRHPLSDRAAPDRRRARARRRCPPASFYKNVTERKQPMIFYVDSPWSPDPGYSMTLYFDSEELRELQQLQQRRRRPADRGDRAHHRSSKARLRNDTKAQEIVMDEAPWGFIAYPNYHDGAEEPTSRASPTTRRTTSASRTSSRG